MTAAPRKKPAKAGAVNGSPGALAPDRPVLGPPAALSKVPAAAPGAKARRTRGAAQRPEQPAPAAPSAGLSGGQPAPASAAPGTTRAARSRPAAAAGYDAVSGQQWRRPAAAPAASAPADPTHIRELVRDPANRRLHTERNVQMIAAGLRGVGAARSIVIDESNTILAGNGVAAAAAEAGITKVRVIEADGAELIAVRRRGLSDAEKRDLALYDNRAGELSTWNFEQLQADHDAGLTLQPFWTPEEQEALLSTASADEIGAMAGEPGADDEAPSEEVRAEMATFICPVTVGQERIVRSALAEARTRYQVTTTGEALTAALEEWQRAKR